MHKVIVAATGAIKVLMQGTPNGVAVDAADNAYVAETDNNSIKEIVAATGAIIQVVSGFSNPEGLAVDAKGRVYVIDAGGLWAFTP